MNRNTVTVTVGVSGSGKTYYRFSVWFCEEWYPNHVGKLICNYPVNLDELEKDYPNASNRIEIISQDVLKSWRDGSSGPWDYFSDRDISGCHIAIDEIHNFCGKNTDNKIRKKWMMWLGELRHQGATCEFLTQSEAKCAKEILNEAEIRLEIINGENRLFPLLGYRMGDLYEFRAKFLGKYLCPSFCVEYVQAKGKWHQQKETIFYRFPKYFKYYDSFSAPEHGKALGNRGEKRPWEKYSWPGLFLWFYATYPIRINFHLLLVFIFCYMFFGNGFSSIIHSYFNIIGGKTFQSKVVRDVERRENIDSKGKKGENLDYVNNGNKLVYQRVVKLKPWEILTPYYMRLRDGRVFYSGMPFYNSVIVRFERNGLVFLDDGFCFPVEWLEFE